MIFSKEEQCRYLNGIKRNSKEILQYGCIVALFLFVFSTSIAGVDFGRYSDESNFTIPLITKTVEKGVIIPGAYGYPSLWYSFSLIPLVPYGIDYILNHRSSIKLDHDSANVLQNFLVDVSKSHGFLLQTRTLFIFISLLTIFWIYILVRKWRNNITEAFFAAAIFGLSWEINYHVRWITPHGISMQFVILTILFLVYALKSKIYKNALGWLLIAASSAGIATGAKYPSGLLLVPLFITFYILFKQHTNDDSRAVKFFFGYVIALLGVYGISFFLTTPGVLLDPIRFLGDVMHEIRVYLTDVGSYQVAPGLQHFLLIFHYLVLVLFSKYIFIAVSLFVLVVIGAISLIKEEKKIAIIFFSFPLLYVIFLSSLGTMYVRNLLELVPFLAILSARGISFLLDRTVFKNTVVRYVFISLVSSLLFINAQWLVAAAKSIQERQSENYVAQLVSYVDSHQNIQFVVSEIIAKELKKFDEKNRVNINTHIVPSSQQAIFHAFEFVVDKKIREDIVKNDLPLHKIADFAIEQQKEKKDVSRWTANRFNYTILWFGPYDANFNYYPNWFGNDRILVMPLNTARSLDLF